MTDIFDALFGGDLPQILGDLWSPTVAACAAACTVLGWGAVCQSFCDVLTLVLTIGGGDKS